MRILALVALSLVLLVAAVVVRGRVRRAGRSGSPGESAYADLRAQILHSNAAELGIALKPGERVWGVLMDVGYPEAVATVVALRDGNASIYLSSGGGIIGGVAHESVRGAALRLNALAERRGAEFARTDQYPLPTQGQVRFYVLTTEGAYSAAVAEAAVQNERHPLFALYAGGQDVITALRQTQEGNAPGNVGKQ